MIDKLFWGKKIGGIPNEAFRWGFDDPGLLDQRSPGLVLAATCLVPDTPTEKWFLGVEQTDGMLCDHDSAAFLPLEIRPEWEAFLDRIIEEEFAGPDGLDYYSMDRAGCTPWANEVLSRYLGLLEENGLIWTPGLVEGIKLKQALYPVDATPENIALLSSTSVDLAALDPNSKCGFVIWIVGGNCD